MGIDLLLPALALAKGTEPDWLAAAEAIDDLRLETIWGTGDDFFPWENWVLYGFIDDPPHIPAAYAVYLGITNAQVDLRNAAAVVRRATIGEPSARLGPRLRRRLASSPTASEPEVAATRPPGRRSPPNAGGAGLKAEPGVTV